jgi:hypothetical protein
LSTNAGAARTFPTVEQGILDEAAHPELAFYFEENGLY